MFSRANTIAGMHSAALIFIHFIVLLAKMLRPTGWKKIVAENLMLKHQLAIMARSQKKARTLHVSDRVILAWLCILIPRKRLSTLAVAIQPATIIKFHRALV